MAFRHHFNVQVARIVCGAANRIRHIQFFMRTLPGKLAQASQRHLDITDPQCDGVVQVLVGALFPHLHGFFVT